MTRSSRRSGHRLYGALLRLLPQEFRGDFGEAMTADFEEARSTGSRAALWRREVPSLIAAAVREHLSILSRSMLPFHPPTGCRFAWW